MTAQFALFRDGDRASADGPSRLRVGSSAAITEESVRRALDCGAPLLVREVWQCLGADGREAAAAVADALLRLEAAGRARCDLETMRWEAT